MLDYNGIEGPGAQGPERAAEHLHSWISVLKLANPQEMQ